MRKPWWILTALAMFVVIEVHAETLKQCKAKCTISQDTCIYCCDYRENNARNACSLDALKKLSECRAAGKTEKADGDCDAAFVTAGSRCRNEATELELTGKCPRSSTTSTKKPK